MNSAVDDILICSPNWLGDSIMCMPAIQAYKKYHPTCCVRLLVKPHLQALWKMHSDIESVILLGDGLGGMRQAVRAIKGYGTRVAFIFPNSFRSACVPLLARVEDRIGRPGHRPSKMLTRVIPPCSRESHQASEYLQIVGLNEHEVLLPELNLGANVGEDDISLSKGERVVGIMPGAAYGASKRWPADRFIAVGRALTSDHGCRALVLGNRSETKLCETVATGIGPQAISMGGKTSLPQLAGLLHRCNLVICNDSGGMHLAATVRTPVVAVFGITDPTKTGPIGGNHRLIFRKDVSHSRELSRNSKHAMSVLSSIKGEEVGRAAMEILEGQAGS